MLQKLSVHNYALIRELEMDLDKGLTIITGETGAGKSILLGALSLILGSRADTNVLLDKKIKCVVEGTFRLEGNDLTDFFSANELDFDSITILRREINPAGKSRAFINDTPVTINVLKELGDKLIDIHSQHQTLMLNENSFQLDVIDSFAGNIQTREDYRLAYNNYRKLKKEYNEMLGKAEQNKADLEYYKFQLNQLVEAKLVKGEQEELEKEQEILEHSGEIKLSLDNASLLAMSHDDSIINQLKEMKQSIARIKMYLPEAEEFFKRIDSVYIELNDLAAEIEKLSSGIEADPKKLSSINDRLDLLYSLSQKHRVKNVDELLARREELSAMVSNIVTSDERLEELESRLENELKSLKIIADKISGKRVKIIPEVEGKITDLLRQLGMPNARFRVDISKADDFNPFGIDKAEFLFSANKQVPPENLSKVASGGELSRVMLSLKSVLTKNKNLPTIIFDEIDSGVSGEVADKVGQILSDMGNYMQVINITHLPQVASRGSKHYFVYKDDDEDSTITRVKLLSKEERILEVAKLLSGSEVTETAIKNARELFKSAVN
jgi:DNA repair protein RecN (Recombination protein N)